MVCLPSPCRCEARLLAPFVRHYNKHAGAEYVFDRRLDIGSPTPQPEALYIDARTGTSLVIERKNLVWPCDFAQLHNSLHMVTNIIETEIASHLDAEKPYRFWMPDNLRGSLPQLRRHAREVGEAIVNGLDTVHSGHTIGSTAPGREWRFRVEGAHDRDWDEPPFGTRFVFGGRTSSLDWGEVPDGLRKEVQRLLKAAKRKFVSHSNSMRILVLDFIGDIRHPTAPVLTELFASGNVPSNIDEIWFFTHDLVTELHYGWIFRPLWPTVGHANSELCGETVVPTE